MIIEIVRKMAETMDANTDQGPDLPRFPLEGLPSLNLKAILTSAPGMLEHLTISYFSCARLNPMHEVHAHGDCDPDGQDDVDVHGCPYAHDGKELEHLLLRHFDPMMLSF